MVEQLQIYKGLSKRTTGSDRRYKGGRDNMGTDDTFLNDALSYWGNNICDQCENDLIAYREGLLEREEIENLLSHFDICEKCRKIAINLFPEIFQESALSSMLIKLAKRYWDLIKGKGLGEASFDIRGALATRSVEDEIVKLTVGEVLNIYFEPPAKGSLLVVCKDAKGEVSLVFPNKIRRTSEVQHGRVEEIEMIAPPYVGNYTIKAIFIDKPLDIGYELFDDTDLLSKKIEVIILSISRKEINAQVAEAFFSVVERT